MKRDEFIERYIREITSGNTLIGVLGAIYDTHMDLNDSFKVKPCSDKVKAIESVILSEFNISISDLKKKTRIRAIVEARQITAYLIRSNTKLSLSAIGKEIGGLDHATIIHSIKSIENYIETDKEFSKKIQRIINKIKIASIIN